MLPAHLSYPEALVAGLFQGVSVAVEQLAQDLFVGRANVASG